MRQSSISIFLEDNRLGEKKSRLIVIEHIETLLVCLSSQLNSIEFESITLSSEDEAELFSMLDLIAEILSKLEPNFVGWFICWFVSFVCSLVGSFVLSFVRSFVRSFFRSFVRSFVRLFVC